MSRTVAFLSVLGFLCALADATPGGAAEPDRKGVEFFEKKIRPVLVKQCYQCHSAKSKKVKGELLLDTRDGIRKGGESGHAVIPGNLDDSLLLSALRAGIQDLRHEAAETDK